MIRRLYVFAHIVKYKLMRAFYLFLTEWRLKGNNVCYKHYRSVGSPLIENGMEGKILFGENLNMNNSQMSSLIGYRTPCIFRTYKGSILVGDNVGMTQTTLVAIGADVIIGDNVKLGRGVKVFTTDFHSKNYLVRRDARLDMEKRKCANVILEEDCFVGSDTIILKGVTVGARSIIGAGSVVVKDVPPDCLAAGNPCRVISDISLA